jgi:fluoride ion exporter CrcB/FEX
MEAGVREFIQFWFNEEFFTIGIFSFLGSFIRILIYNRFVEKHENEADENYGPFIQMFYTQPYLLPNFLGCFIMGFLYNYKDEINRRSKGIFKGLTTGFCGSLTTFSSWAFTSLHTSFDHENWYKIIIMIFLVCWLTWSSFVMGTATSRYLQERIPLKIRLPTNYEKAAVDVVSESIELGLELTSDKKLEGSDFENESEPIEKPAQRTTKNDEEDKETKKYNESQSFEWYIWCLIFTAVSLSLWITLLVLPTIGFFQARMHRDTFRAVCLAPLGSWLRWSLTRFPDISGLWPEMHVETLIANECAVLFQCLLFLFSKSSWNIAINYGEKILVEIAIYFPLHNHFTRFQWLLQYCLIYVPRNV